MIEIDENLTMEDWLKFRDSLTFKDFEFYLAWYQAKVVGFNKNVEIVHNHNFGIKPPSGVTQNLPLISFGSQNKH